MARLEDEFATKPVLRRETVYSGKVWNVVKETADLGPAGTVEREFVEHTGAVAVLAFDDAGRIALIRQYRHPVRHYLWEPPAGLLDVRDESPLAAAQRELAEEADLHAGQWHVLLDWYNSPGGLDETVRIFLARDVKPIPASQRHQRTEEEADIELAWFSLDEAREAILASRIHNPATVVGVLAACAAHDADWATLRPPDAPWPTHKAYR